MKLKNLAIFLSLSLVCVSPLSTPAWAAKKKAKSTKKVVSKGPNAREKKLMGWTSDYPTAYDVKNPNFFVRGSILSFEKGEGPKEYRVQILPLEVLNNPQHYVKLDHYKNGIPVKVDLSPAKAKDLKLGGTIEYNFYTKEVDTGGTGHARIISDEIYSEVVPYNVSPVAYLIKTDLEPEQALNALKAINLYEGNIEKTEELKTGIAKWTKSKDLILAGEAKKAAEKLK